MRIFIAHILSKEQTIKRNLSIAAYNFSSNLISTGLFDKSYSLLPTFVNVKKQYLIMDNSVELIYSSKMRIIKFLSKFAIFDENIHLFKLIPSRSSVWFYNLNILNILLVILLRLFKPTVNLNVIILDFTPAPRIFSLQNIYLWFINHLDGNIRLANSNLFTLKNSICLPGVVPIKNGGYPRINGIKSEFLISGVLNEKISMLSMLLDAFSKMPNVNLHIAGYADANNERLIKQYVERCNNIIYHGLIGFEAYLVLLDNITFALSMRDPLFPENKCNFPSKILEFLLHNRIIISTFNYEQLNGINYFVVSSQIDGFILDIQKILNLDVANLMNYSNQSELIQKRFSPKEWEIAMNKIESYNEKAS